MSETLLTLKAGRAFRREGSNFVEPHSARGAIVLANGDDGLLHFLWRNRTTNEVEEDLILFPSDATFVKVTQSSGRVYVLKFSSSNQRHFFWLQDASSSRDDEFVANINGLLQDANYILTWGSPAQSSSQPQDEPSASASPPQPSSSAPTEYRATPDELAQLQSIVASMSAHSPHTASPDLSLTDILTPANLNPLFASHPELIPALFPHLPLDLPVPPSAEELQRIVISPQFRAAVRNFDQALHTGLLGGLVRSLGLPEEAGTSLEAFLRAIQDQARSTERDSMSTD